MALRIKFELKNFDSTSTEKIEKAVDILFTVANSKEFKKEFIKEIKKQRKKEGNRLCLPGELSKFRCSSPTAIYNTLMNGSEALTPGVDHCMNLYIDSYFSWRSVVGYTNPSIKWIIVNRRLLKKRNAMLVASNIFHEWGHKLGFKHKRVPNHSDNVCYIINMVFERVAQKLFPEYKPKVGSKKCRGWWIFKRCS